MSFEDLGLSQPILQALDQKGYTAATPIQTQAIPLVLEGRDLLGIAQTGTGKTAAFMLPAIDNLREAGRQTPFKSCRMLVLAPTRELAGQIAKSAMDYGGFTGLRVQSVVGGTSVGKDRNKLHRGTDILVATPGRLLDLVDQKAFRLDGVEILVLDEADQMLDLGFIHALKKLVALMPKDRQTLLFSATMPSSIKDLSKQYLSNPAHVSVTPAATTAERVEQYVTFVSQSEKQGLLELILRRRYPETEGMERVLIFTRTKHGADRVVKKLGQAGITADAIHGNKSQPQRERAIANFKSGRVPILVATDIAARGIDIPGVSHVVNFELPNVSEQYVHRIGRTARAGADGIAMTLCSEDERAYLRDIQKLTGVTCERLPLPDNFRAFIEDAPIVRPKGNPGQVQQPRAKKVQPKPLGGGQRPGKRADSRADNRSGDRPQHGGGSERHGKTGGSGGGQNRRRRFRGKGNSGGGSVQRRTGG
ncbi:DEAD/DEAH box helicase [Tsuneonella sp. YG55]|uniref:DEAD/DEAH box helicase n=1 Tax=Tsuneonella litorea TaxID=2976475 RepID=A0A9X2W0H5_9SPHN|nr:DEAD/DEAH box helicase [Tsuneonella litorea]MCT2558269.1 DEAD/DEAH box helicase [Tsuneonella litorea]